MALLTGHPPVTVPNHTAAPAVVRANVLALDPLLEAGAASALRDCPDIEVTGATGPADVTVMIVDRVTRQVLDAVRDIRRAEHGPGVVLVATELDAAHALHAVAAGVRGLLRRHQAASASLARTVLAAATGDCTVPPDLLDDLLGQTAAGPAGDALAGGGLDERERAVLRLVADGRDTDEIARALSYSARTVTGVLHDVTHRFRLRNRAHAVAFAMRAGLL